MLTLHHLNQSRSHRIIWLLEELGIDYQIKQYQRDKKTMLAPPELKAVHPLGKSPVITDGEDTVAESAVIIDYLLDKYDEVGLRPEKNSKAAADYRYWMHYAEGSMMPPLLLSLIFGKLSESPTPLPARPVGAVISKAIHMAFLDSELEKHIKYVDSQLENKGWFAGEQLSGADIQMSFPLEAFESRRGLDGVANVESFLKRIRERPAYQKALSKGGPVIM
jgi:glutathione S-transferase